MGDDRKVVLLVGHCGPDAWALKRAVNGALGEAEVRAVLDDEALEAGLADADLLLVNRVLDGHFADDSGIDLIRTLTTSENPPPVILVSNFEDAQQEAEAAGARPGFGKTHLYDAGTRERIAAAVMA